MFTRPFTGMVLAFGHRDMTQRLIVEEVAMGMFLVFPVSLLVGQLTIRVAASGPPKWLFRGLLAKWIRPELWTTAVIFIVADIIMELLIPSLQCLPLMTATQYDDDSSSQMSAMMWLKNTWGFSCPSYSDPMMRSDAAQDSMQYLPKDILLSPSATAAMISLRLFFVCQGVYFGESFLPIALTGGIACGKSTVSELFLKPHSSRTTNSTKKSEMSAAAVSMTRKQRKSQNNSTNNKNSSGGILSSASQDDSNSILTRQNYPNKDDDVEGTFFMVYTDTIGHEILLPPWKLKKRRSVVHPNDSVFPEILEQFSDGNEATLLDNEGCIDRGKLGAIIFDDPTKRRILNKITHPKIILILIKRLLIGSFCTTKDIVCAEVPLLFESAQLRYLFGLTVVVACNSDVQLERLKARNPDLTPKQCKQRIASQMSVKEKVKLADLTIWNNETEEELEQEVERVRKELMGRIYGIGLSLLQMLLLIGGATTVAVAGKLYTSS